MASPEPLHPTRRAPLLALQQPQCRSASAGVSAGAGPWVAGASSAPRSLKPVSKPPLLA